MMVITAFSSIFRARDLTSSSLPVEIFLAPEPHPESLLVLYLETQQELDAIAARLSPSETTPANPYWQRTARAFADPDGFQLLLTLQASRAT